MEQMKLVEVGELDETRGTMVELVELVVAGSSGTIETSGTFEIFKYNEHLLQFTSNYFLKLEQKNSKRSKKKKIVG